ncbi:MAG: T9SS type A sorting domain-containing protein [Bacteroidota bacterium]
MKYFYTTLLLFPCSLFAQEAFFNLSNPSIPITATGINSMDVESADVDGDGDLDIAIAGEYTRNLLLFNDGNGVFSEDPTKLFPKKDVASPFTGQDSEDIAFADFDLDGDLDILFVTEDTPFHELLINDGNGKFTFINYDFDTSNGNAVAVLDLNADTYPDIIIGNTGQNDVYLNNQDLTFTKDNSRWSVNTEGTQDFKLVDLDGDGDLDIVEGIDAGSNNILINQNGFFVEENDRLPNLNIILETRKIALGDANGDGHIDIFVATVNFTGIANLANRLYLNDGNGFFSDASGNLPLLLEQTLDAVFLDYDLDNDLDLITVGFLAPGNNYRAYENDGNGQFTLNTAAVFQNFSLSDGIALHTADFNGDGFSDIYFGGFNETDDLLFYTDLNTNTTDFNSNITLELFPNPCSDKLYIKEVFLAAQRISSLEIYAMNGQFIRSVVDSEIDEVSRLGIAIHDLAEGQYMLLVKDQQRTTYSSSFIVVRE